MFLINNIIFLIFRKSKMSRFLKINIMEVFISAVFKVKYKLNRL